MLPIHGHSSESVNVQSAKTAQHLLFCLMTRLNKVIKLITKQGCEILKIDIGDIRDQVENCRDDMTWIELPLAAKIRVLVKERLSQMEDNHQINL